jgi:hypothetical protein
MVNVSSSSQHPTSFAGLVRHQQVSDGGVMGAACLDGTSRSTHVPAHPQMHPPAAGTQAVLTAVETRPCLRVNLAEGRQLLGTRPPGRQAAVEAARVARVGPTDQDGL